MLVGNGHHMQYMEAVYAQLQFTCMCDDLYQNLQRHIPMATTLQTVHPAINCLLSACSLLGVCAD